MSEEFSHATVMRDEVVRLIAPRAGGRYMDCTCGGGGHGEAILEASGPDGMLVAIDRDPAARAATTERLARFGARVTIMAANLSGARGVLDEVGWECVDGLVADLGVSSSQLDVPSRGFSFRSEGPIDMRMNPGEGPTAGECIRAWTERELADVIYRYGEERASRPIARAIKRAVERGEMNTTRDLARAVYSVLGPPRHVRGIDPATRTFQAIRIAVNDELGEIEALLAAIGDLLCDDGVAAILSFHSLEDGAVKHGFRENADVTVLTKKPLRASESECAANPRARSAKLRAARRRSRSEREREAEYS